MKNVILCSFTKDEDINNKFQKKDLLIPDNVETYTTNNAETNLNFAYNTPNSNSSSNQLYYDKNGVVLCNGTIYNKDELVKEYMGKKLKADSTAQVISNLYNILGDKFVNYLKGSFNICIYDKENNKVSAFTDRLGMKPLFYSKISDKELCIGSDMYSMKNLLNGHPEMNEIDSKFFAKNILLDSKVSYDDRTPFKNIKKLEPGHCIEFELDKDIEVKPYFDLGNIITDNTKSNKRKVYKDFKKAIQSQVVTDKDKIGIALSGGFDSSLVSVLASRETDKNIEFYTFDDTKGNFDWVTTKSTNSDMYYAKTVFDEKINSSKNNREHVIINNNANWSLELIDKMVTELGMPIYDERALGWHNLYTQVEKSGISVMLGGQGADELWHGYYPKVWGYWFSILYHSNLNNEEIKKYFDKWNDNLYLKDNLSEKVKQDKEEIVESVSEKIMNTTDNYDQNKTLAVHMAKTVLPFFLYTEAQVAGSHGVELRSPFLDEKIVETAVNTEINKHLLENKMGKDFLKDIFKKDLPEGVISRKKAPLPRLDNYEVIMKIFKDNIASIKKSPLINEIYNMDNIDELVDNVKHPLKAEELLQVISTWRFEEIYCKEREKQLPSSKKEQNVINEENKERNIAFDIRCNVPEYVMNPTENKQRKDRKGIERDEER